MTTVTASLAGAHSEAFYLSGPVGPLCAVYHRPHATVDTGHDVIHVHSFANELYDTRPVIAYQARAMATAGVGVLLADLTGCGDSVWDFGDATWDIWKADLEAATCWLKQHRGSKVGLWGTRLGATLAMDFARDSRHSFTHSVLWQPVVSGDRFLTQFLRLRVAFSGMKDARERRITTKDLRDQITRGESVEVAGFAISPGLASGMSQANLEELWTPNAGLVYWVEVVRNDEGLSPASQQAVDCLRARGATVDLFPVNVRPFWMHARAQANEYPELVEIMRQICAKTANL